MENDVLHKAVVGGVVGLLIGWIVASWKIAGYLKSKLLVLMLSAFEGHSDVRTTERYVKRFDAECKKR